MKILAIGAHPDDIEIFMFGILCHFKNKGDNVNLLIATDGSLGGKGNTKMRTFSVDVHVDSGSLSPGDLIVPLLRRESGASSGVAHFQSTLLFYTEV